MLKFLHRLVALALVRCLLAQTVDRGRWTVDRSRHAVTVNGQLSTVNVFQAEALTLRSGVFFRSRVLNGAVPLALLATLAAHRSFAQATGAVVEGTPKTTSHGTAL